MRYELHRKGPYTLELFSQGEKFVVHLWEKVVMHVHGTDIWKPRDCIKVTCDNLSEAMKRYTEQKTNLKFKQV